MRLPFFIARRYFVSKKSQRAINIISMISVSGVLVGTAALVIVLSVFNGFEDLILRLYNSFDPDVKIEAVQGKTFALTEFPLEQLRRDAAVSKALPVIEENALVRYSDRQYIVMLKGVFSRLTAYLALAMGLVGFLYIGSFFIEDLTALRYLTGLLAVPFYLLVGVRLYKLGRAR